LNFQKKKYETPYSARHVRHRQRGTERSLVGRRMTHRDDDDDDDDDDDARAR